jgi:NAD(P) transhydrogenase
MVKLVFDRATRRLVGCHCIGERASELFNHPTLGETFKYAAYDALTRLGPAPGAAGS